MNCYTLLKWNINYIYTRTHRRFVHLYIKMSWISVKLLTLSASHLDVNISDLPSKTCKLISAIKFTLKCTGVS